jgi:hypothetical protein
MASKWGVDIRAVRILLETGVAASYEGLHVEGEEIVRSICAFRDDVPQPGVCLASSFFFQKRFDESIAQCKITLRQFPNCQMAKAMLGTSMFSAGYRDWELPLKEVIEDGRDEWAIDMARNTLGYSPNGGAKQQASGVAPRYLVGIAA